MFEKKRRWALAIIPIQVALALLLLWLQHTPICKIVTLAYILLCFIEMTAIYHVFREKAHRNSDLLVSAFRIKRHDVLNSLQILHTMAQMGKREEALKYIRSITASFDSIDRICRLTDIDTQSFLLELFFYYRRKHIDVVIDVPEDFRLPRYCMNPLWNRAEQYAKEIQQTEGVWEIKFTFDDTHVDISSRVRREKLSLLPRRSFLLEVKLPVRNFKL